VPQDFDHHDRRVIAAETESMVVDRHDAGGSGSDNPHARAFLKADLTEPMDPIVISVDRNNPTFVAGT
jgi:hypothetical protein